ncbi:MAG: hypothetical protein JSR82_21690 [Verrucomicrobia bacterium]|nr:hypothetical protein [Verrucomicrobiota bacterium]
MALYRNPDPPAESFWVTIAAIWVPLLALFFWAQDAVPVGGLILLGIAFNVAALAGLSFLRPEGRPGLAEQRQLAFLGFHLLVSASASAVCLVLAIAVSLLLVALLPSAPSAPASEPPWVKWIFSATVGLLFPRVRLWLEERLLALLARCRERRADPGR